jgi:hypothetical protein
MISNNVEFSFDQSDRMYVATVKIINKQKPVTVDEKQKE